MALRNTNRSIAVISKKSCFDISGFWPWKRSQSMLGGGGWGVGGGAGLGLAGSSVCHGGFLPTVPDSCRVSACRKSDSHFFPSRSGRKRPSGYDSPFIITENCSHLCLNAERNVQVALKCVWFRWWDRTWLHELGDYIISKINLLHIVGGKHNGKCFVYEYIEVETLFNSTRVKFKSRE